MRKASRAKGFHVEEECDTWLSTTDKKVSPTQLRRKSKSRTLAAWTVRHPRMTPGVLDLNWTDTPLNITNKKQTNITSFFNVEEPVATSVQEMNSKTNGAEENQEGYNVGWNSNMGLEEYNKENLEENSQQRSPCIENLAYAATKDRSPLLIREKNHYGHERQISDLPRTNRSPQAKGSKNYLLNFFPHSSSEDSSHNSETDCESDNLDLESEVKVRSPIGHSQGQLTASLYTFHTDGEISSQDIGSFSGTFHTQKHSPSDSDSQVLNTEPESSLGFSESESLNLTQSIGVRGQSSHQYGNKGKLPQPKKRKRTFSECDSSPVTDSLNLDTDTDVLRFSQCPSLDFELDSQLMEPALDSQSQSLLISDSEDSLDQFTFHTHTPRKKKKVPTATLR